MQNIPLRGEPHSILAIDNNIPTSYQSFIYSPTDALVSCFKKQY